MSGRIAKSRRRSAWGRASTFTMTVTAAQAELIERSIATEYSLEARIGGYRGAAIRAFWQGLQALREGRKLGELQADPESPVFAKLPEDFTPGPRRLTLTEEATAVAEFMTEVYAKLHPKEFQETAERIMDLGLAQYAELILRGHGSRDRAEEPEPEPREPRVRWPKGVTGQPTATVDDLPDLFLEDPS
jgi:hypothetical protein